MKIVGKKGTNAFNGLASLGIAVASLAIILVVVFIVLSQGKSQIETNEGLNSGNLTSCETSVTCNATNTLTDAMADIPDWVPLIVITVIGLVMIGLIKGFQLLND